MNDDSDAATAALRALLPEDLPLRSIVRAELVAETPRSTVIRLHAEDGAQHYFKRDHILPPPEAAVIVRLARRWPTRIAPIVAADEHAGWTLTTDVGPERLDDAPTECWERMARHFAEVQRDPGLGPEEWLALGCRDLRGSRLGEAIDAMLVEYAGTLPAEERAGLSRLGPRCREACRELARDDLPATLVHQDLVPVNIVLRGSETVFIDWSDTVVGHPFFGFDRLLDACWTERERKAAVIDAYLGAFAGAASTEQLRASFGRVLSLRVLYECVRWHHEITALGAEGEHAARLARDITVGLGAMARTAPA